ncbi:helix-turn-helix domain-containing protein [Dyadobacter luticola]|uniref:Helix-turn-helix domain-containing protein n=1 Tax=Dyadobacter luticola TaxID=1979387 RepID=A0A5R9L498_9BACT|nr:helix-turn-helix domain-containing protein [Dyadobacter luticola]TLV03100.1 helix-turn-helix domain-containing protein [Dyadobacter luticola]
MSITGQRIKKYRELKGLSQDELARRIDRPGKQSISHWETGRSEPSLAEVRKLAEVLDATVAQLVGEAPMFEEPREQYIMVKKDDLIDLQRKVLEKEQERIKSLEEQLKEALSNVEDATFEEIPDAKTQSSRKEIGAPKKNKDEENQA